MHGYLPDQTVRDARSYEDAAARHVWKVPPCYAIADDLCDRHADGRGRPALLWERQGRTETWTFDDLHRLSSQLAAGLRALGLGAGDRAALMLPQTPEHALAHVAVFRLGAVSLPLSRLFGSDALRYRLGDSEARVLLTDGEGCTRILQIWDDLPALSHVILCEPAGAPPADRRIVPLAEVMARGAGGIEHRDTSAEDPALLIYTSGTTGPPKGAPHAQRYLLGYNGVDYANNFFRPGDLYWSPADWAGRPRPTS